MEAFIGTILPWAPNFAPVGWMLCQGQTLAINSNQALFALIGTMYGGNGTTNFMLPNLQGAFPLGASPTYIQGARGGTASETLTVAQLPVHTHVATFVPASAPATGATAATITATLQASAAAANTSSPTGNYLAGTATDAASPRGTDPYENFVTPDAAGPLTNMAGLTVTSSGGATATATGGTVTIAPIGSSMPLSIMPPYQVINYIICIQGLFPSR